ncbi:MAG TPA: hypothetical protein VK524_14455, partial [Polyangiaceae bacterium]|nr:hypothetical protein [Polyangiaceae bacterium]
MTDSASGATDSGAADVLVEDSAVPDAGVPSPFDAGFDAQVQDAGTGAAPGDADADACSSCQEPKFQFEMGYYFGCAWRSAGAAKCWGSNAFGQLGLGTASDPKAAANPVTPSWPAISLASNARVDSLVAGSFHACAILSDGSVRCWGSNSYGQLGYGDTRTRGLNADELGAALPKVQLGTGRTARKIAAGNGHSCALLDDGSVKCWGRNHAGQLGIGTGDNRGDEANEMGDTLPRVELGTGRTARAIYAGSFHTCALLDNATVKCWGHNQHGQLGLGDVENRGDSAGELGNALPEVKLGGGSVVSIYAGGYSSCAFIA